MVIVRHIQVQNSVVFVATSAEQVVLFRVVRGHPIPESTCWTSPIVMQPVEKRPFLSNECVSMETCPRLSTCERIPENLSYFALLVAGDAPSLAACFVSIRGRVSGAEFKIKLKSFVSAPPNKSTSSPTAPQRQNGDDTSLPCGTENFSKLEKIEPVLPPNTLINVREVASGATQEEIQCRERRCPQKLPVQRFQ